MKPNSKPTRNTSQHAQSASTHLYPIPLFIQPSPSRTMPVSTAKPATGTQPLFATVTKTKTKTMRNANFAFD